MTTAQVNEALRRLGRVIGITLAVRSAFRIVTLLLLGLGLSNLLARALLSVAAADLLWSLTLAAPAAALAAMQAWRSRPRPTELRALLDGFNRAGGLVMASESTDVTAWADSLRHVASPRVRWSGRQPILLLTCALAFCLATLSLPDRALRRPDTQRLQIGQLARQLESKLQALEEEKVVDERKAAEFKATLEQLQHGSEANDPARTWEAIDHLQQSAQEKAEKAAEETLARLSALSQAETLAAALSQVSSNLSRQTTSQAVQALQDLTQDAETESALAALTRELATEGPSGARLEALTRAIGTKKLNSAKTITNLAKLRLIDPRWLGKCAGACRSGNTNGLAALLRECDSTDAASANCALAGRGGVNRGRGDAPMTWSDPASEEKTAFKEESLPSGGFDPTQAQLVAISSAQPEVADASVPVESGALRGARSGGGAAHAQRILPRHRRTVERFFQRSP